MNVGDRLKKLREKKDCSQEHLAKELGLNRSTYARYETNSTEADYNTLRKLADYHDVTVDYILGRSREPHLTEEQDYNISFAALKGWRDRIAAGEVVDIPKERIPHIVDALDKEIMMIEAKLKDKK